MQQGTRRTPDYQARLRANALRLAVFAAFLPPALAFFTPPAAAQLQLPRPVGYVNDFAGVIDAEHERRIDAVVQEVRARSGGEIAIVTLPSLDGRTRDEVGLQIMREWGVGAATGGGDPRNNTGAVILVVPSEREWKIELGYTTNTFVTAAEAGRIGRDHMLPEFRRGDFGRGILAGTLALAAEYADHFDFELTGEPMPPEERRGGRGGPDFTLLLVIAIIIYFLLSGRGRGGGGGGRGGGGRRGRAPGPVIIPFPLGGHRGGFGGGGFGGGGFGGGGFGGFGGGMGGGGGAGGRW